MWATFYSCGALLAILLASHGVGRQTLRRLELNDIPPLGLVVWSLLLGFIAHAGLFSLAAFAGALSVGFIGGATVVTSFWGLGELACAYLNFRAPNRAKVAELDDLISAGPILAMPAPLKKLAVSIATVACGIALVGALTPPIASCVLSGTLDLPKQLILGGSRPMPSASAEGVSPQFTGMLYAWAFALDGPVAASLLNWTCGLLLLAATALLAKPLVGSHYAWLAGLLPLASPGLRYQMTIPLADLPLAMFSAFALAAWWRGMVEQTSNRWLVVAGVSWGAASATNAAAVALLAAVALVWCHEVSRSHERRYRDLCERGGIVLGVAALVAIPWWTFTLAHGGSLAPATPQAADWRQLGPLFFALTPGLLLTRRLRGMHAIGSLALCITATSWLIAPQSRVYLMLLPLLAILGTWVLMELARYPRVPRLAVALLLFIICVAPLPPSLHPLAEQLPVVTGWQPRDEFLRRHVPNYAAAQVANRVIQPDALLASNDPSLLYFGCRTQYLAGNDSANSIAQLKASGVTHVLWRHEGAKNPEPKPTEITDDSLPLTSYSALPDGEKTACQYELRLLLRR